MNRIAMAAELTRMAESLVADQGIEDFAFDVAQQATGREVVWDVTGSGRGGFTLEGTIKHSDVTVSAYVTIRSGKAAVEVETYDLDTGDVYTYKQNFDVSSGPSDMAKWLKKLSERI